MDKNDSIVKKKLNKRDFTFKEELILVTIPTIIILTVLGLVDELNKQKILFTSLSASAFLIYLDPHHDTNSVRTLIISQISAATVGLVFYNVIGPGYLSGGISMVITIIICIAFKAVHPPAISTALSFAFRSGDTSTLLIFGLAVLITSILVLLEKLSIWTIKRIRTKPVEKSK